MACPDATRPVGRMEVCVLEFILDSVVPCVVTIALVASVLLMISIDRDLKKMKQWYDQ